MEGNDSKEKNAGQTVQIVLPYSKKGAYDPLEVVW